MTKLTKMTLYSPILPLSRSGPDSWTPNSFGHSTCPLIYRDKEMGKVQRTSRTRGSSLFDDVGFGKTVTMNGRADIGIKVSIMIYEFSLSRWELTVVFEFNF